MRGRPDPTSEYSEGFLGIGRGSSSRQIPFSSISRVVLGRPGQDYFLEVFKSVEIGIEIILDDGQVVQLGTVSGSEKGTKAQAVAIAQLIADATGVPM